MSGDPGGGDSDAEARCHEISGRSTEELELEGPVENGTVEIRKFTGLQLLQLCYTAIGVLSYAAVARSQRLAAMSALPH